MRWRVRDIANFARSGRPLMLIRVAGALGSTPREEGTEMLVAPDGILGTIGGGQLEFMAIDHARTLLADGAGDRVLDIALGPGIGQCCGGRVELTFENASQVVLEALLDRARQSEQVAPTVCVFGAGHVGAALAKGLSLLPFNVQVIDVRAEQLKNLPENVVIKASPMPEAEVRAAPPGSAFIAVAHDHALDFLIAREALNRADAAYVGMIGSRTKRAQFRRWSEQEDFPALALERFFCPIGGSSVDDKRPEIIAALTIAEIIGTMARTTSQERWRQPADGAVQEDG